METQKSKNLVQASSTQATTKIIQNPSREVYKVVDGRPEYDFGSCLKLMEEKGRQLFGEKFKIYKEDHQLIYKVLVYVIGDLENASKQGLSLKKGLLLTGPVGCGKTSLMKLLSYFQPSQSRFLVRSCRDISFAFIKDGYEVIRYYSNGPAHDPLRALCFDDLGTESNLKYYGNECNVMGEILLSRYDLYISKGLFTHTTTNCNSSEIEQFYGNRVRSRMREMFNLLSFDKDSNDKRV